MSKDQSALVIQNATYSDVGTGTSLAVKIFNSKDDPHATLKDSQAFVIPEKPLEPNTSYKVTASGTDGNNSFNTVYIQDWFAELENNNKRPFGAFCLSTTTRAGVALPNSHGIKFETI